MKATGTQSNWHRRHSNGEFHGTDKATKELKENI